MKRFIRTEAQKSAEGKVSHAVGEAPKELPVHKAQQYIAEGHCWVLDLDWEKFFDRVNHDRLLAAVAERVADKRTRITELGEKKCTIAAILEVRDG